MLALDFYSPWLLLGLLAAGIPFLLHLLSSVRAQEVYFPTLRFLRLSMEKTARRRRIQHWLLLLLRAALLALLALAVSEPVSQAVGGWMGDSGYASVLILDNSLSMGVREKDSTRLARARGQALALLNGDSKPALAALMTTNGGMVGTELTGRLDGLRDAVTAAPAGYGRADLAARVAEALKLLGQQSSPQKSICIFSDLQRVSFEDLAGLRELAAKDAAKVHLLVVNTAQDETSPAPRQADDVGVAGVEVLGQPIVNRPVTFSATLVNSSPTNHLVQAELRIEGKRVGQPVSQMLAAAGQEGSSAVVRFSHFFTRPGPASGEVLLDSADDLPQDNVRRFSVNVGGKVQAVVVRGASQGGDSPWLDPARMLLLALDPFEDASAPTSIQARTVEDGQFNEESLKGADIAFFCEKPAFSASQAEAVANFAAAGGTVVLFLGPDVQADNYNEMLLQKVPAEGGLLPGRLTAAVGEVGPDAKAESSDWADVAHPYLQGLFENHADYLTVLVQRHYQLSPSSRPGKVLLRLANGDALVVAKPFGTGQVVLCTTTASPRWSNFPAQGLYVAMMSRMSLLAPRQGQVDFSYLSGSQVVIRPSLPPAEAGEEAAQEPSVLVSPPEEESAGQSKVVSLPLKKNKDGQWEAVFTETAALGVYRWRLSTAQPDDPSASGAFVVNPSGPEVNLQAVSPEAFKAALAARGIQRAYVAPTIQKAFQAASADAKQHNWWDLLAALAIVVLVAEAVVANRRKREDAVPPHLNPQLAKG